MNLTRPKPRRERVRLEVVIRDARLQLRQYPGEEQLFDAQYVEELLDLHAQGAEFDPLEIVCEQVNAKHEPKLWLIDGFNRAAMFDRAGVGTVDALVYPGTFREAELWAMSSNSRHGRQRTPEECRKAFEKLVTSPTLLEEVVNQRGRFQGTERALAAVAGISHGAVGKYLAARGLRVDRLTGKLIRNGEPDAQALRREAVAEETAKGTAQKVIAAKLGTTAPTVRNDQRAAGLPTSPRAARAGEGEKPVSASGDSPTVPAPPARASGDAEPEVAAAVGGDPVVNAAVEQVADVQKNLRAVARGVNALLASPAGGRLRTAAAGRGVPFEVKDKPKLLNFARHGDSMREFKATWPALEVLTAVFAELGADLAAGAAQDEWQAEAARAVGG